MKQKIYIADDHAIMREGLKHILINAGYEIAGDCGNGRDALIAIEQLKPDMVILDISMPGMTGIEITRHIRKYLTNTKIIILSRHDTGEYVDPLIKLGIHGYILKEDAGEELIRAVEAVRKGERYLSPRITKLILDDLASPGKRSKNIYDTLSNREREILKLVAEGKSSESIASILFISEKTVKVHRANIMKKLGFHKTADLVKYAIKEGIIEN